VSEYLLWFGCLLAGKLPIELLDFHLEKFLFFLELGHFNRVYWLSLLLFNLSAAGLLLSLRWGGRLSLLGGWDCGGRGHSWLEGYFPNRRCM